MVRVQQPAQTDAATVTTAPQFAKPILQYTKPRQEALQIRRALTLYLKAQIEFAGDSPASHISLCAPHNATNVKRVPPELNNGLRAQYLKALQANLAAKKEYAEVLEEISAQKRGMRCPTTAAVGSSGGEDPDKKGAELQTYLGLLRSRREHGKIQIFQHYLGKLNKMEAGQAGYLGLAEEQALSRQAAQDLAVHVNAASGVSNNRGTDVEALLHGLERAVLRAKNQADIEKKLLEKLKSQRQVEEEKAVPTSKRLAALRRTHTELVSWVEEKLVASSSMDEAGPADGQAALDAEDTQVLEATKSHIQEQYAAYVEARKALLSVVSTASQPLSVGGPQTPQRHLELREKQQDTTSTPDLALLFPYVSENLLPLSKAQKASSMQKSYLSAILAKEKWTTCRMLDRLQDESHLLPEYPILARQPRFNHAIAAINRRSSSLLASPTNRTETSEIVTRAEAWSFAAKEAQDATKGYIDERTEFGTELAQNAELTLKEMYELMNQDYEEATASKEGEKDDEGDIWAETRFSRNRRPARAEKRPKGPWSGLNGKVGVIGDG
ncbi:hypothetical protein AJ79_05263 [Helicocarpus griseus UAMH5409]|uniref:Uncharacterized protein n=1 Tax=Helicocarpus griseus UAMH5409 TaxID=1447875 RepID=A0A2B7XPC5_9EURO|nr:hypothetical protein AJ79_05263 [Helicocarpus griseus UAMH5409]